MTHKISEERINEMLNAFTNGDQITCNEVVNCFVSGALWLSKYFSEVPMYKKHSLARKAARYIAQTALKGSFEVDGLAVSCGFCEMEAGYPKTLGDLKCFTFQSKGNKITCIFKDVDDKQSAIFTDHNGFVQKVLKLDRIYHTSVDRIDLVHMFEDILDTRILKLKKKGDFMISNKYIIRSVIHHDIIGIYDDKSEAIHKAKMRSIQDGKAYHIYKQIEVKGNMLYKCVYIISGKSIIKIKDDCSYDKL